MNTMQTKIIAASLLFLLVFLTGFWLTRTGKPYAQILFTLHKLIALGAVIYLSTVIAGVNQSAPLQAGQWLAVAAAVVCAAATIISGGLLSVEGGMPPFLLPMHRVLPFLTIIAIGVSLYLILVRNNWITSS